MLCNSCHSANKTMIINNELDNIHFGFSHFCLDTGNPISKICFLHSNYDMGKGDFKNLQFTVGDKLGIKCTDFIQ